MAPHSSTLAWKIPWTEEPGRLQSMGSLRVRHDWATLSLFSFMHWRRKWQPTPVFLPGESQGRGSLLGCRLWDSTESDTTEAMTQQQQQHCCYGVLCRVCASRLVVSSLFHPTDCSPPGFSFHGIFQARMLEWIAISSSRGSFWHRDQTCISCIYCTAGRFFTPEPPGKPYSSPVLIHSCQILPAVNSIKIWKFYEDLCTVWFY